MYVILTGARYRHSIPVCMSYLQVLVIDSLYRYLYQTYRCPFINSLYRYVYQTNRCPNIDSLYRYVYQTNRCPFIEVFTGMYIKLSVCISNLQVPVYRHSIPVCTGNQAFDTLYRYVYHTYRCPFIDILYRYVYHTYG